MNLTEAGESLVEVYRRRMLLMSVGELHPVRRRIDMQARCHCSANPSALGSAGLPPRGFFAPCNDAVGTPGEGR